MKEEKRMDHLDERLKAALLEEEKRLRNEIENDPSLKKYHVTEEMDKRMAERIRKAEEEREAYERLSEEDKEAIRIGRELQLLRESEAIPIGDDNTTKNAPISFKKKKRTRKVFLLVAVVTILVLAMGMTSIGGRPFILELVDDVLESRELTKVNSEQGEEQIYSSIGEEEKFYQEVEETFRCQVVRMEYMPKDMCFLEGHIENGGLVYIIYEYDKKIVEYQIVINYRDRSYGYDVEDELIEEETFEREGTVIELKTYQLPSDEVQYVAQFEYEKSYYTLNAVMEKEEFKEIIKNFIFL